MIPTSFELAGHSWTVHHVQGDVIAPDGDKCKGLCEFDSLTISVNVTLPPSMVWHTFMHEVMHAVLYTLGHELTSNEGFVDSTGALLAQVLTSAVGTKPARPRVARPSPSAQRRSDGPTPRSAQPRPRSRQSSGRAAGSSRRTAARPR